MSSSASAAGDPELRPMIDLLPRSRSRRSRTPRADQPVLSRELIVRTAVELADAEGPEAISMRRIARQLGAGTMSPYWYVADREALLAYMLDHAMADLNLPESPSGAWRADLELLAREFLAVCRRHAWLPLVLGTSPYLLAPQALRPVEFCFAALRPHLADVRHAGAILRLLNNYVVGAALREATETRTGRRYDDPGDERAATVAYLQQVVATGRYPAFAELIPTIIAGRDLSLDEHFGLGLECLLDGIGKRLLRGSGLPDAMPGKQ
jgi:AcrR family transcriptional regulator